MICNSSRHEMKSYLLFLESFLCLPMFYVFHARMLLVDPLDGGCLAREANEDLHQAGYLSFREKP